MRRHSAQEVGDEVVGDEGVAEVELSYIGLETSVRKVKYGKEDDGC